MTRRRRGPLVDLALSAAVAFVVLGPTLLHRGYVLRGDMVFVPDMPWKAAWLGLDGRVPRFVPGDAFVAAVGAALPGDLVQKAVLVAVFLVGGTGVGRLLGNRPALVRAAAITFFLWNPWVLERLAIGQWGVVVGYALLPWTVLAAERVRESRRGGWPALVSWLGVAAVFSPASGLVAVVVTLAVLAARPRAARLLGALAAGVVVNLPWIIPGVVTAPHLKATAGQFTDFGPRAESSLGVVGSVLSLGGIWKGSIVPGERTDAAVVTFSLLLTVLGVVGLGLLWRTERARVVGLASAAAAATGLVFVTAVPALATGLDDVARVLPVAGIVRDSHRYLGPLALAIAVGIASVAQWLWESRGSLRDGLRIVAALVVIAPLVALPSLAWGLAGTWRPVSYPDEWFAVRPLVPEGRTVVLPWAGGYRGFAWNARHAALDPAPRFFPGDVIIDDRLLVGAKVVVSEDPLLRRIRHALDSEDPTTALRRLGVGSVLVEKDTGPVGVRLPGAVVLHDGPGLSLIALGTAASPRPDQPSLAAQRAVLVVDGAVLLGWLTASGLALVAWMRGRRAVPCMVRSHSDTGEVE